MKDNAFCNICNSQINNRKECVIYNRPKFGIKYVLAHKHCYDDKRKKYKNILKMDFFERLDSLKTYFSMLIMLLFSIAVLWKTFTLEPDYENVVVFTILPLAALACLVGFGFMFYARIKFLFKYRI